MDLLGFETYADLKEAHLEWVESKLQADSNETESKWTQGIAVGSKMFIEKIKDALGFRAKGRKITSSDDTFELREGQVSYGAADKLDSGNTFLWN